MGTVSEWLESLKGADGLPGKDGINGVDGHDGADGRNGIDGQNGTNGENGLSAYEFAVQGGYTGTVEEWLQSITPDLSLYITRVEILKIIDNKVHSSAPDLSLYVTRVETQKLIESKFQTVESDLTSLENTVNREIQAIKDSVELIILQAHWHHNLILLNSLTSAKIAKWDRISNVETELQQFKDSTQYDQENQNDAILNLENRITILELLIHSENNGYTMLFEHRRDAISTYGANIGLVLNGGFHTMTHFCEQYPNFCCEDNNYALSYNQDDFNWDAPILTVVEKKLHLTSDNKIQFRYTSDSKIDKLKALHDEVLF